MCRVLSKGGRVVALVQISTVYPLLIRRTVLWPGVNHAGNLVNAFPTRIVLCEKAMCLYTLLIG